jgi:hypothetical protein
MNVALVLLALVCFVVETFDGHIGSLKLVPLGLAFLAAALAFDPVWDFARRRRTP